MKYFVLNDCVNKLEFACHEYLISFQKHYRSKSSRTSRLLAEENRQAVVESCFS